MLIFGVTRQRPPLGQLNAFRAMGLAFAVAACGSSQPPNPGTSAQLDEMSLDSLRATITVFIGEALASSASQCRAIAFGRDGGSDSVMG